MRKGIKILLIILVLLVLGLGFTTYYLYGKYTDEEAVSTEYAQQLLSYGKTLYVAIDDIKAGDTLLEGKNVERQNVITALSPDAYIDESDIGKKATSNITNGTPIYKSLVVDSTVTNGTRLVELSTVTLPLSNVGSGVYVDVRIMFPNGEDYIVLPKKRMMNLYLEQSIFTLELEEDEILTLSSAIVDTYTVTGTRMYVTTYVAPNVQEAPNATYLVRKETIDLITNSPNVIKQMAYTINAKLREEMEERLSQLTEEQLTAVAKGLELTDTASASVLLGIQREETEILNEAFEIYPYAQDYDEIVDDPTNLSNPSNRQNINEKKDDTADKDEKSEESKSE